MTEIAYAIQTGTGEEGRALWMCPYDEGTSLNLHEAALVGAEHRAFSEAGAEILNRGESVPILMHDLREDLVTEDDIAMGWELTLVAGTSPDKVFALIAETINAAIRKRAEGGNTCSA